MTAIKIATDIPSNITTLEQLAAWASMSLTSLNPLTTAIEGQGYTERVSQSNIYYIAPDNKYRLICRQSLEMSADYLGGGKKLWMYAQELSSDLLPPNFKTN